MQSHIDRTDLEALYCFPSHAHLGLHDSIYIMEIPGEIDIFLIKFRWLPYTILFVTSAGAEMESVRQQ